MSTIIYSFWFKVMTFLSDAVDVFADKTDMLCRSSPPPPQSLFTDSQHLLFTLSTPVFTPLFISVSTLTLQAFGMTTRYLSLFLC